jgi:hypothetical protein
MSKPSKPIWFDENYYALPKTFVSSKSLTAEQKLILIYLIDQYVFFNNLKQECFPSEETIAEKCGLSERTVNRHIVKFIAMKVIIVTRKKFKNHYIINGKHDLFKDYHIPDNLSGAPELKADKVSGADTTDCHKPTDKVSGADTTDCLPNNIHSKTKKKTKEETAVSA